MQIDIRHETPDDYHAVRDVNLAAFETPAEADLIDRIRHTPQYIPALSLVAIVDGVITGHALFSEIAIERQTGNLRALALGPIAVLPAYQRQGIGTRLIETGHQQAAERGYPFVVLLGHPEYYPRFGYVPAGPYGLSVPWDVPPEAFMVCELVPGSLESVAGQVRYAEPFLDI